jgi:hypothetical protein
MPQPSNRCDRLTIEKPPEISGGFFYAQGEGSEVEKPGAAVLLETEELRCLPRRIAAQRHADGAILPLG